MVDGLAALYRPESIAVIGASDDPDKVGGRSIGYLDEYGFRGNVFPVNPNRDTVQGIKAYHSVAEIDAEIDVAIIATPAAKVLGHLEECGKRGVRACIVFSSGFGEVDEAGRQQQDQFVEVARRYSMRVLGPNCQGVANMGTSGIAAFSTCFSTNRVRDGAIAIVSQSGAVAGMLSDIQHDRPAGIRFWAATGNEADVGVAELVDQALQDPAVRVVEVYCEHLKNADLLARAARRAAQAGKTILMLKAGVTPAGTGAAGSHTGALAQDDAVVDAFLRHHGIVRVQSLQQLADYAQVFASPKPASGNRLAILTNSGGLGVMMADRCARAGLELAELRPATRSALAEYLPAFAATGNPIDVTAELLANSRLLGQTLTVLAADPGIDTIVVALGILGKGYDVEQIVEDLDEVNRTAEATLAVCWIGGVEYGVEELVRRGVATFTDDAACMYALGRYASHGRQRELRAMREEPAATGAPGLSAWTGVASASGFLSENASKQLLRSWDLPVVDGHLVQTADEAVAAAGRLGYPVVLKLCSAEVTHKTELGLVCTGLATVTEVRAAAESVRTRADEAGVDPVEGLLVEAMAEGAVEIALGARRDPNFGMVMLLAAGGVHVEALADFQLVFPSASRTEFLEAIRALGIHPVLANYRGIGPLDEAALADLLAAFATRIAAAGSEVAEVDLNPVFVAAAGRGVTIADALIRLDDGGAW